MLNIQNGTISDDHRVPQDILKLEHIPWPCMCFTHRLSLRSEAADGGAEFLVQSIHQVRNQHRQIALSLAKCGKVDREHVKAPVNVFSQAPFGDGMPQVTVRCRNET